MYEAQGYRIPLPESEELNVPEPTGVDITQVPSQYLADEYQTDESAIVAKEILSHLSRRHNVCCSASTMF